MFPSISIALRMTHDSSWISLMVRGPGATRQDNVSCLLARELSAHSRESAWPASTRSVHLAGRSRAPAETRSPQRTVFPGPTKYLIPQREVSGLPARARSFQGEVSAVPTLSREDHRAVSCLLAATRSFHFAVDL